MMCIYCIYLHKCILEGYYLCIKGLVYVLQNQGVTFHGEISWCFIKAHSDRKREWKNHPFD